MLEYKSKKKEQGKIFRKRTKKGQPIMKDIANRLLSKLEKDANKQ